MPQFSPAPGHEEPTREGWNQMFDVLAAVLA
jgi:hypothetical protein